MIIKNSTSTKRSNHAKDKEQIKYSYNESFKRENKSLLDDSELIKNYNDSLESALFNMKIKFDLPGNF